MATYTNPTEIARETLKLLTQRRLVPTPENYQKIYCEIAGVEPQTQAGEALLKILKNLAKKTPAMAKRMSALEKAVTQNDWAGFESGFAELAGDGGKADEEGEEQAWGELIRDLLKQWQIKHKGYTAKRKQEGLERVLINFGSDAAALNQKIRALITSWTEGPAQAGVEVQEPIAAEETAAEVEPTAPQLAAQLSGLAGDVDEMMGQLRDLLAQALEHGVAPRLSQFPELSGEATSLAAKARQAREPQEIQALAKQVKQFWFKLEIAGESDAEVLAGMLSLLRLLVDNISELMLDDQWLHGQIAVVQDIITSPINSRALFEAERSFKEVIFKQGALKQSLNEAKTTLKTMLTTFIDRLGDMSESTSGYHDKIENYAVLITQTEDIHQLNQILADLARDTRGMQLDVQRSRDELIAARKQVEESEEKIRQLETELEEASEKVREDHLTGALNRRGLNDVMEREFSRADRTNSPLCLAMLDLDHFKKLNDTYGHQAGDEALLHLVHVVKEILRPSDVIARFGGEEFIILLPDTQHDEAIKVMTRLQRDLTKNFFLHNNERLLITFSAGVALRRPKEPGESVIERADKAVYKAKESGRNRVEAAD